MSKKAIVIYNSKRGSTKQYAEWIASELGCTLVSLENLDYGALGQFDVVIFGSWLRGSGIVGFDKFRKQITGFADKLIIFVTGISEYNPQNYQQICEINFKEEINMQNTLLYFCPGRYRVKLRDLISSSWQYLKRCLYQELQIDLRNQPPIIWSML